MDDQDTPGPRQTIADDLISLTGLGVTDHSVAGCQALADFVFGYELPPLKQMSSEMRKPLVRRIVDVVDYVTADARRRACETYGQGEPKENPACQAAAAGELLHRTDEGFDNLLAANNSLAVKWQEFTSRHHSPARLRQLRAAIWLGGQTDRTVRMKIDLLFTALATAINDYLDAEGRRTELRALAVSHLEQAQPGAASTNAAIPSAATSPEPLSRPQLNSGLPEQQRRSRDPKLQRWFEDFVDKVRRQLEDEHSEDKVTDPIPMPVRWSITEQCPADQPINVWGEGDGARPSLDMGTFDTIIDLFELVPSRRLVVLGRGGAGKTVLVRELALAMLKRRPDDTVPVIFQLSSWNPDKTTFRDWMVDQLIANNPASKAKIRNTQGVRTVAAALVDDQHILPILDGLDEVALPFRSKALQAINRALHRGDHLVLTSRPTEYAEAVEAGDVVTGAAVVELHDLTPDDLDTYLPRTTRPANPHTNQTKWNPVLEQLRVQAAAEGSVVNEALTTPLMASLARATYSDTDADPADLLDVERFPNATAISNHLLDAFIQTRFDYVPQGRSTPNRQWSSEGARRWLGLLATSLFAQGTRDFTWWRIRAPIFTYAWVILLSLPVIVGVTSILTIAAREGIRNFLRDSAPGLQQPGLGLIFSCTMLIVVNYAIGTLSVPRVIPSRKPRKFGVLKSGNVDKMLVGFMLAMPTLVWGALGATIVSPSATRGLYPLDRPVSLPAFAFYIALVLYILTFVVFVRGQTDVTDPRLLLRRDLVATTVRSVMYGLASSLLFSVIWVTVNPLTWPVPLIVFLVGFFASIFASASGQWYLRGTAMTVVGLPPWRFMTFLSDACDQGVLRRSGGLYQFRHALLQERLAANFAHEYASSRILRSTIHAARPDLLVAQSESGLVSDIENELRSLLDRDRFIVWPYLIEALQRSGRFEEAVHEAQLLCEHTKKIRRRRVARYYYDSRMLLAGLLKDQGKLTQAEEVYSSLLELTKDRKVVGFGFATLREARTDIMVHLRKEWIYGNELSQELSDGLNEVQRLRELK